LGIRPDDWIAPANKMQKARELWLLEESYPGKTHRRAREKSEPSQKLWLA